MRITISLFIAFVFALSQQGFSQQWNYLEWGTGLHYSNQVPGFWPTSNKEAWIGFGLPYPPVQVKNDSSYSFLSNQTELNPVSNPLVGAFVWKNKTITLHGFLPAYRMGIFGRCNGGVLEKTGNVFRIRNSLTTNNLSTVSEKFWYNSAKPRLDSAVWIAADTGFRRLALNDYKTSILKDPEYQGIALFNKMAAQGEKWAGFRNDYGIWCITWGDSSAKILSGVDLGIGPNRFVFDIAETPENDTLFTASDFLGNISSNFLLFKRKNGQTVQLSEILSGLPDSLTFVETEADGTIWATHRNQGLFQIRNNQVRRISLPDSLANAAITGFKIDEGKNKWLSLDNRGMLRLNDIKPLITLPEGKRVCLGDSFLFQNLSTTVGLGIRKVFLDLGYGDTSSLERFTYTFKRPGKWPIKLSVFDSNGAENSFTDSIIVDYGPSTELFTENTLATFCSTIRIWSQSPFSKTWTLPNGQILSQDTILASENGRYLLTTRNGVCSSYDSVIKTNTAYTTVDIAVRAGDALILTDTITLELPENLNLSASSGVAFCLPEWTINGVVAGSATSINHPIFEGGLYEISLTTEILGGCPAISNRNLFIIKKENLIPNVVTKNGDGKNEFWEVKSNNPKKLSIFNRWGKTVFQTNNYGNNWPESETKPGTYFYKLDLGGKIFTGWLEVLGE